VPSGVGYLNISIGMVCPLAVALRGLMLVADFPWALRWWN
jgi:hypothetical protein